MEEAVKVVDLRSKLLSGTLSGNGIVSVLTSAHMQREQEIKVRSIQENQTDSSATEQGGGTEWGDLLDKYFLASKQLDDMHAVLTPMFALAIPTPRKVPLPPTEPYPIPQLMSTSIAPEDVDKIKIPPKGSNSSELLETIANNNAGIEGCIAKFNIQLETWKKKGGVKRPREA